MQGIDQKPKAVLSRTFSGHRSRPPGELRGRWEEAAKGRPEPHFFGSSQRAAWGASRPVGRSSRKLFDLNIFFRVNLRRLERLFAGDRPKAEGCLEPHFFELSQRVTWGASRSVWKGSRRSSGMNIFSGYISERWRGFSWGIDQKPKAVLSRTFSGHRSRPPGEPRGRYGKAAEGSPA